MSFGESLAALLNQFTQVAQPGLQAAAQRDLQAKQLADEMRRHSEDMAFRREQSDAEKRYREASINLQRDAQALQAKGQEAEIAYRKDSLAETIANNKAIRENAIADLGLRQAEFDERTDPLSQAAKEGSQARMLRLESSLASGRAEEARKGAMQQLSEEAKYKKENELYSSILGTTKFFVEQASQKNRVDEQVKAKFIDTLAQTVISAAQLPPGLVSPESKKQINSVVVKLNDFINAYGDDSGAATSGLGFDDAVKMLSKIPEMAQGGDLSKSLGEISEILGKATSRPTMAQKEPQATKASNKPIDLLRSSGEKRGRADSRARVSAIITDASSRFDNDIAKYDQEAARSLIGNLDPRDVLEKAGKLADRIGQPLEDMDDATQNAVIMAAKKALAAESYGSTAGRVMKGLLTQPLTPGFGN